MQILRELYIKQFQLLISFLLFSSRMLMHSFSVVYGLIMNTEMMLIIDRILQETFWLVFSEFSLDLFLSEQPHQISKLSLKENLQEILLSKLLTEHPKLIWITMKIKKL